MNRIKKWMEYYSRENVSRRIRSSLINRLNIHMKNLMYYHDLVFDCPDMEINNCGVIHTSNVKQYEYHARQCIQLMVKIEKCNLKLRKYDKINKTIN